MTSPYCLQKNFGPVGFSCSFLPAITVAATQQLQQQALSLTFGGNERITLEKVYGSCHKYVHIFQLYLSSFYKCQVALAIHQQLRQLVMIEHNHLKNEKKMHTQILLVAKL